ncbi:MAG: DUF3352 domain-containing protein [Crocosphaera sp.]
MSTNNKSGCGFFPLVGATAIIAAGTAGAYYYFQGELPFLANQSITPLVAAEVIPESAFASGYLSTNEKAWQQLSNYGTPEVKKEIETRLEELDQEIFSENNISFAKDIQPWIDGITIAFLPPRKSSSVPEDVQSLIVIGVQNKLKAKRFFDKLQIEGDLTLETREYQNIIITKAQNYSGENFSFALLGNRLVLAEKDYTIETAIDSFQGSSSYADKPTARKLLKQPLSVENSLLNIYIPNYGKTVEQFLENTDQPIPETSLKQLEEVESIVIGLGAEKQGLHLQAIANLDPDKTEPKPKQVKGNILGEFPGRTFLLANGQGINEGWNQLVEMGREDRDVNSLVRGIRSGFRQIKLDADRDIFNWMDGEFGFGVIELDRGGIANFGLGGMILLETSDRSTASNTLEKFTEFAQSNASFDVNEKNVKGTNVVEWIVPGQGVVLSHGWLNKRNLMVTLGTSFEVVKESNKQENLLNNPNFKEIKSSLPSQNLGYFYLDFAQLNQQLEGLPGGTIPPETKPILESIKGLGMTVSFPNDSTSQFDAVLSIDSSL